MRVRTRRAARRGEHHGPLQDVADAGHGRRGRRGQARRGDRHAGRARRPLDRLQYGRRGFLAPLDRPRSRSPERAQPCSGRAGRRAGRDCPVARGAVVTICGPPRRGRPGSGRAHRRPCRRISATTRVLGPARQRLTGRHGAARRESHRRHGARRTPRLRPRLRADRNATHGRRPRRRVRPLGGLDMLVAQAERQFELWTGQRPPAGLFAAAAERTSSSPAAHTS